MPVCLAGSGFAARETQGSYVFLPVMKNEFESVTNEIERNDCISDEVEYEYHDILKELDNFIYAQNCLIEKDTRIAEIISEAIKTNGDNT